MSGKKREKVKQNSAEKRGGGLPLRHITIILLVLAIYIAGCAHNHKTTEVPSAASPPSLHQSDQPTPSFAKQKTTANKKEEGVLTDEDLDFLYEEAEAGVVRGGVTNQTLQRVIVLFHAKPFFLGLQLVSI